MSSEDAPGPEATETGTLVGAEVDRKEDASLITGQAKYTDDLTAPRMVHAAMARSPYGHASIENIDTSPAEAMDGVLEVYTQADIDESAVKGSLITLGTPPGVELPGIERPLMARDEVYYQGEAVATVLAEDRYTAHQAADRIEVDYQQKETYTDPHEALEDDAEPIHEEAPDNKAFTWGFGPEEAVEETFQEAEHTVDVDLVNQRIIANPIEPRGALAQFASADNKLRIDFGTQMPSNHRAAFADALDLPEHKIHVHAPEIGGGFGTKAAIYPDEVITAWCSMQEERPVKWIATRTEAYQTDGPGRGHSTYAELALDEDGVAQAMRVDTKVDIGGYVSSHGSTDCTGYYGTMLPGNYSIPAADVTITGVYTNKTPRDAYRGAGRPEATYVIERLMETAAKELDMDPAEIRQRNFIEEDEFPYESSTGQVYDSGAYEKNLEKALDVIGYEEFRERQKEAREEGKYLGIGLACLVENAGAAPAEASAGGGGVMSTFTESGMVRVNRGGTVTAYSGTSATGTGTGTAYRQIIADELGVPVDDIEVIDGDTEHAPDGSGTMGSHSGPVGGAAIKKGAEKVYDKARRIAAHQ
ncbi:MAG: xanthine dehydrogenase family protein molybdopterin-binding subunit, partial [Halovenus sp.]